MATTVLFKICEKGEAYNRFQRLKPYLRDKEYIALKLVKKHLTLLKSFLKDGNLPSQVVYDFKTFEVSEVDLSNLEYKGYLETDHQGLLEMKPF